MRIIMPSQLLKFLACSILTLTIHLYAPRMRAPFLVLINPLGNTNRIIGDHFERTITSMIARAVQQRLQPHAHYIELIVARKMGEQIEPLAAAQLANRMSVQLALTIGCCSSYDDQHHMMLYRYANMRDNAIISSALSIVPDHDAYLYSKKQTVQYAHAMQTIVAKKYGVLGVNEQLHALPCSMLRGYTVPALYVEWLLHTGYDEQLLVDALTHTIQELAQIWYHENLSL